MNKMKILIVDDEPLAQDVLETYVEQMPELELVAKCNNALEANTWLEKEDIDLILLDIQMPQLSGTEFVKTLNDGPMIIFTTAYPNYALEGFELDAVDYLLKPISLERFLKAINKAKSLKQNQSSGESKAEDFVFVKADKKLVKVNFSDVIYIEGLKDYVIIKLETGRIVTLQTMKSLEKKLPSDRFRRIHRSYIVNMDKVKALVGNMIEVTEKGQHKNLPVGKNYRDELYEMIQDKKL